MALVTALSLSACSSGEVAVQEIKTAAAISIEDGGTSSAKRVIALANGSAEILVSLGLKQILIGRDIASTEEVLLDIPIVTSGHQVVAENILKLNPDLVLIDDATGPLAAIKTLRENGIKIVLVRQAWTLSDINLKIADIAGAVGAIPSGAALSEKINQSLSEVKKTDRKARIDFPERLVIVTGYDSNQHQTIEKREYGIKESLGGCHMTFRSKDYVDYLRYTLISHKWDTNIYIQASRLGGKLICTIPSVIQHIGCESSVREGNNKDKANDF